MKKISTYLSAKEILIGLILFFSSAVLTFYLYGFHDKNLITASENVYFQADIGRSYDTMSDRKSPGHYRAKVHPLLPIQVHPPVFLLTKLGISTFSAVKVVVCTIAAIWCLFIYGMFRLIGNTRPHAILMTLLGLSSASAFFWLTVPESYALGSINLIMALGFAALANHKKMPNSAYIVVNAITLSTTITNWMAGISATLASRNIKETIKICLMALAVVTIIWGVQKRYFPTTVFFLGDREEANYMFSPNFHRIIAVFSTFFFHTLIAPAFTIIDHNIEGWPLLSFQNALPTSNNLFALAGSIVWLGTLIISAIAFFSAKTQLPLKITLGLTLLGQLCLHLFYGEETFLYALHFLPLLLVVVSIGLNSKNAKVISALICVLIPLLFINNFQQFQNVNKVAVPPNVEVSNQFLLNPNGVWPRGEGQIVLANPGSKEDDKSYYAPGGSFSPAGQKYGVSINIEDSEGHLRASSDNLPLGEIKQTLLWEDGAQLPAVNALTEFYEATWRKVGMNDWQLTLAPNQAPQLNTSLMIRSVGPAGGPIRDLLWNGQTLIINNKWQVRFNPLPKNVILGDERVLDARAKVVTNQAIMHSDSGWATAKVMLFQDQQTTATFSKMTPDLTAKDVPENAKAKTKLEEGILTLDYETPLQAKLEVNLPDQRFADSLNAQVAHMSMGIVGNETRPGDPLYYPLDWQRDGAYILVALLKAGQLETAHTLSKKIAEQDFYGGFGAEADAPGLSIWALNTVANQIKSPSYDQWIWPHVQRKVAYIEKMLSAKTKIEAPFTGKVFSQFAEKSDIRLIAEPAKNGLIMGRMDNQRPVLFVNAISYLGLNEAANLAERLNFNNEAALWRSEAANIKKAWREALKLKEYENDRTYISAVWPSWVGNEDFAHINQRLETRWHEKRDHRNDYKSRPLWTYFELAEAHQWLLLGNKERSWATLDWFWNNQSSPGLYTWWEGDGSENFSLGPKKIRGAVKSSAVTPHYWTAAEMTLLQLDMLGFVDHSEKEPILVIGQGVLEDWLSHDMAVKSLRLEDFMVDWSWHDKKMHVNLKGKSSMKVKLSNSFDPSTPITVTFEP